LSKLETATFKDLRQHSLKWLRGCFAFLAVKLEGSFLEPNKGRRMKPSDSRQLQNNQQWLEQYRELQEYARDNKRTDPPFGHPLYWWTVAQW